MFRRPGERDLIAWLATDPQSAHGHSRAAIPRHTMAARSAVEQVLHPGTSQLVGSHHHAASWTSETPTTPHIRSDGLADGDCLCHVQSGGGSLREPCVIDQVQAAVIHLGRGDQRDHVVVIEALLPASPAVPLDE